MADETDRLPVVVATSQSPHARLGAVPVSRVRLSDEFWAPRLRINRDRTLPSQYRHLEDTGTLDNFRIAAGKLEGRFQGMYFSDSDVYKWLEAASWALASEPDPDLERSVDAAIAELEDAQDANGYLNTYFSGDRKRDRWTDLATMHELYCAGHLIQAAVAHHRATGSGRLLAVASRLADHVCETFGPEARGQRPLADGHEEIEMALVELFRETGVGKYLDQAKFFIDIRGRGLISGREYHQDHKPFRDQDEIVGHAVRAVYLNAGAADLYIETGEKYLLGALERLWNNMVTRRMYVTGGIGARYEGESLGEDFELPNDRAYAETCAAVGSVMWNFRMLAVDGDPRFADLIELILYNAILPGISLDGQSYFYQNPLADEGTHRRRPWFRCACCPPNVARMLTSLPGYFYGTSQNEIWVHLFAEGSADIGIDGGVVRLSQRTRYPWDGDVEIEVAGKGQFALMVRIPAWTGNGHSVEVNGQPVQDTPPAGSYAAIERAWRPGDVVRLRLPMDVRRLECHPYVSENAGRVALMRGPVLYCIEEADNPGLDPRDLVLPVDAAFRPHFKRELLGGVVTLSTQAEPVAPGDSWKERLYRPLSPAKSGSEAGRREVTAIPYFGWANREPGVMRVWLRSE
jgi:DUF1680 family protein